MVEEGNIHPQTLAIRLLRHQLVRLREVKLPVDHLQQAIQVLPLVVLHQLLVPLAVHQAAPLAAAPLLPVVPHLVRVHQAVTLLPHLAHHPAVPLDLAQLIFIQPRYQLILQEQLILVKQPH